MNFITETISDLSKNLFQNTHSELQKVWIKITNEKNRKKRAMKL